MKSLVVLCLFVAAAYALPAKNSDSYDDYEGFSLFPFARPSKKEVPVVVDYEVGGSDEESTTSFFRPHFRPLFINPFSFMNFGFSDFFSRPSWFDSLIPKGSPDAEVKNSTSSTKIVDGHKITVNQTTYENEKNGAIFKVQIIEVSPVDSTEKQLPSSEEGAETTPEGVEAGTAVPSSEEVKPDSNSLDNEIHREEMLASYELQGDDPSVVNNDVEMINLGNGPVEKRQDDVDLSSDIRVNKLLAENALRGGLFMVPPEVEVFDTLDHDYENGNYQQQIIEPQFNQEIVQPQFYQQRI